MRITVVYLCMEPDIHGWLLDLFQRWTRDGDCVTIVTGNRTYHVESGKTEELSQRISIWIPGWMRRGVVLRAIEEVWFTVWATLRVLVLPAQDLILTMTTPALAHWAAIPHKQLHQNTRVVLWSFDCHPEVEERLKMVRPGGIVARFMYAQHIWSARWLDEVIALDGAMAKLLETRYAHAKSMPLVRIIPNWERDEDFPAGRVFTQWVGLEKLGISGRFVVLYTGNAGRGHEFDTVLQAAQIMAREETDPPVFLFAGYGISHAKLAHEKKIKGLDNLLLQAPTKREEFLSLAGSGDVSLITLRPDMQGVISPSKVHTALALGRPLLYVGPEGTNVDEAIIRFNCGVSLRNGDILGVVLAIRRLKTDTAWRIHLGHNARCAFETAYSTSAAEKAFVSLRTPFSVPVK